MCRNDELSWLFTKDSELFILFAENSQILLKISVIPILLTFIYLVALNLLVNNQLNSSSNSTHHCSPASLRSYGLIKILDFVKLMNRCCVFFRLGSKRIKMFYRNPIYCLLLLSISSYLFKARLWVWDIGTGPHKVLADTLIINPIRGGGI